MSTFQNEKNRVVAERVIRTLQSEKYKSKNYLFLEPFDTNDTPGYLDMIDTPLDLHTVLQNLKSNMYNDETVWIDIANIFNNAIKYHSGRVETKWIAQMATSMLKYMNKERKRAEQIIFGDSSNAGDDGDGGGGGPDATPLHSSMMESSSIADFATTVDIINDNDDDGAAAAVVTKKKKKKLKIKLTHQNDGGDDNDQQQENISDNIEQQQEQQQINQDTNDVSYTDGDGKKKKKKKKKREHSEIEVDENVDGVEQQTQQQQDVSTGVDNNNNTNEASGPPKPKKIKLKKQKSMESLETDGTADTSAINDDDNNNDDGEAPVKKPKLKLKFGGGGTKQKSPKVEDLTKDEIDTKQKLDVDNDDGDDITKQQQQLKKKRKKKKDSSFESEDGMNNDDNGEDMTVATTAAAAAVVTETTDDNDVDQQQPQVKKPKIKLKLSLKKKTSSSIVTAADSTSSDVSDKKQTVVVEQVQVPGKKLKLFQSTGKISKPNVNNNDDNVGSDNKDNNKKNNNNNDGIDTATVKSMKDKKKKIKDKDSSDVTVKVNANPGPRGKELPKAIAEQQKDDAAAGSSVTPSGGSNNNNNNNNTNSNNNNNKQKSKLKLKKTLPGNNKLKKLVIDTPSGTGDKIKGVSPLTTTSASSQGVKKSLPLSVSADPTLSNDSTTSTSDVDLTLLKQCMKVVTGLRLRQQKNIKWFASPITDKKILREYNAKIKYPMDMQTLQSNLEKGLYNGKNVTNFYLNLRRIFANALQFNTLVKDSLRPIAIEVLQTVEDLFKVFVGTPDKVGGNPAYVCSPLLYCWKFCIDILNTIYKLENPVDNQPLALYFFHPVSCYCLGEDPPGYSDKVKKKMDFGTVTANLVEGRYQTVDSFAADCRLVISNCLTYYEEREDGKVYVEQANKLNECLSQQLDQLLRYDKSSKATADRNKAKEPSVSFTKPSPSMLSAILTDLRAIKFTDKPTKFTQACTAPYEEPVLASAFPDYSLYVRERMDLTIIDKKVRNGSYEMIEDFDYDVNLLFKNYEDYNSGKNIQHAVAIAKFGARKFRLLLLGRLKSFEEPTAGLRGDERRESVADLTDLVQASSVPKSTVSTSPPGKKLKIDPSSGADNNTKKKKAGPKISIALANAAASAAEANSDDPSPVPSKPSKTGPMKKLSLPTSTPTGGGTNTLKQKSSSSAALSSLNLKPNQPVPLHIAIARVKEGFPIRRAVKTLQSWEADCARYFKELMRHPWISAARPKFIFHVPVPVLYPELCDTYAAKIKHPMDLTTIECSLLSGNKYTGPEDFLQDVALVFTNAIRFNRDGRDIGDPLSCAYYDASVHLLKYSRWLSFEIVTDYVVESDRVDKNREDGLPPFSWTLTTANQKQARLELESLVLKEPIDISIEGDRWTWHETECEKLLKALRHQSDLKYMTFFIAPNYPHDYAAYISKPMDWEKVQRTLKKRQYHAFGDFIEDLRLIFTNALKYNAKHQGTDNVSGRAYEAAIFMSQKLETAISKMLLTVSDRLERERIDHSNAEREIEATERAEEAQMRAAWKKPNSDGGQQQPEPNVQSSSNPSLKIRNVRRVEQNTDFEIPFFDEEDDGRHESSYFEVVKVQKAMFEKQRAELLNTRKLSKAVGAAILGRHIQHQMGIRWMEEAKKRQQKPISDNKASLSSTGTTAAATDSDKTTGSKEANDNTKDKDAPPSSSSVLHELERSDRGQVQLKLTIKKPIAKKMKFKPFDFDGDD